jgi:hypothetical protein
LLTVPTILMEGTACMLSLKSANLFLSDKIICLPAHRIAPEGKADL